MKKFPNRHSRESGNLGFLLINLRPATIADLAPLRHWDEQPHVIVATDDDWGWEVELHRRPDCGSN